MECLGDERHPRRACAEHDSRLSELLAYALVLVTSLRFLGGDIDSGTWQLRLRLCR